MYRQEWCTTFNLIKELKIKELRSEGMLKRNGSPVRQRSHREKLRMNKNPVGMKLL